MSNVAKLTTQTPAEPTGVDRLALLRRPFEPHHISKLPKPTKQQNDAVKADYKVGRRCAVCGGWHHPEVVHLDYVGHAALTDRLLDVDPLWSWEPVAYGPDGLPAVDRNGALWIKLTVCGVTRLGYGNADGKSGGDAVKEIIGDALRNAAMRFGAALDLWHKGDLHAEPDNDAGGQNNGAEQAAIGVLRTYENDPDGFRSVWAENKAAWKNLLSADAYARVVAVMKEIGAKMAKAQQETFRGGPDGSVSGSNRDVPKPRAEDVILDDEIPF